MEKVQIALRDSRFAVGLIAFTPLSAVFVVLLVSLVWFAWKERPLRAGLWKPYCFLVLTQLLFHPGAIVLGVLYPAMATQAGVPPQQNRVGMLLLEGLFFGSLASSAFWIWRMKGFRRFTGILVALLELPVLGALFVAMMSVTGDWL